MIIIKTLQNERQEPSFMNGPIHFWRLVSFLGKWWVVSLWEKKSKVYLGKSQGSTLYFQNLLLGHNEVGSRLHFSHKSCQNNPRW